MEAQIEKQRYRSDIKKEKVEEMYKVGLSTTEIAKKFNCTPHTIRHRLVETKTKSRKAKEYIEIMRLRNKIWSREKHPNWKGGRTDNGQGYMMIMEKNHPRANSGGYVMEHILIWEKIYNKKLPKDWVIHHLNGLRNDNRPENLIAMKRSEHIHQAEGFKKRIRELEIEIAILKQQNLFSIREG